MANCNPPVKGAEFTLYFTLYKNDGTVIANPGTITKKVSIDGGAVADITAAVTEEDTTYGQCSVVLSADEMNGDGIWFYIKDDTSGCVPFTATIYTVAGDAFARLGAPAGASVSADVAAVKSETAELKAAVITNAAGIDIAADIIALKAVADTIQADTDLLDDAAGGIADIHTDVAAVKTETAELKAAVITNAAGTDIAADIIALKAETVSILADTNELQTDLTNGGRLDLLIDAIKVVTDGQGATGSGLSAVPWNTAWDAEVQSEATDALNAYDPPTNAEMEARTLAAADYVVVGDTIARVTLVDTCTTNTDMVTEPPTTAQIKTALEAEGSSLASILEDTGTTLPAAITALTEAGFKKNTAVTGFTFYMTDAATHAAKTGLTVTAERSLDGAAFASCANAAAELSDGCYKIDLANTDTNGDVVMLKFTATGADDLVMTIKTSA